MSRQHKTALEWSQEAERWARVAIIAGAISVFFSFVALALRVAVVFI